MIRLRAFTIVFVALLAPGLAHAQYSNFTPMPDQGQPGTGWVFDPGLAVGTSWDNNVLVRGQGNETPNDVLNVVSPRVGLDYNGRRGQLAATYDGSFLLYRELNQLNGYDQRSTVLAKRLLTKHVSLFARNTAAFVPTTELAEFVAVPFVRTGSRLEDLRTGVEAGLTKFTTIAATYDFEIVDFDQTSPAASRLQGGYSHGATFTLRHLLNPHLTITTDYQFQHAALRREQTFDIHNGWVGVDYKISELTHIYGAGGISRLGVTEFGTERTGPAWRAGLEHGIRTATVDVHYSRSFVPSYGFGGTMQNEEATARLRTPIGRRLSASSALSLRRDDPLTLGEVPLRSFWVEGTLGYAMTRWVRMEGYFATTHQTITRPGGELGRTRAGIQVVTGRPMRLH